jgi:pSer/pThr/pTyr-binding forkhead associated (FHA) protein
LLLADCDYDLEEVSEIIKPVLTAPQRCQQGLYIQAVTTGDAAFLATNLLKEHIAVASPVSSSWLIGRSLNCPIHLPDRSVSRRHAVIGHSPDGFYITDLGSLNGTWINDRRIAVAERVDLQDGDLVQFGATQIEFFLSKRETIPPYLEDLEEKTTHY